MSAPTTARRRLHWTAVTAAALGFCVLAPIAALLATASVASIGDGWMGSPKRNTPFEDLLVVAALASPLWAPLLAAAGSFAWAVRNRRAADTAAVYVPPAACLALFLLLAVAVFSALAAS